MPGARRRTGPRRCGDLRGPSGRLPKGLRGGVRWSLLSSISEGFPYTLIEAMASGRPCVATDVGGVTEALGSGVVWLLPPRRPVEMAQACLTLLRDADLRRRLSSEARWGVFLISSPSTGRSASTAGLGYVADLGSPASERRVRSGHEPDDLVALGAPG